MFAQQGEILWESGAESVRTYRVEGTRHMRSFCENCGSALPRRHGEGAGLVIPAGSIDGPLGLRPQAHIFCNSRADWDTRLETLPHFDTLPSAVLGDMEAGAKPRS
jgi:hypothetical protein